MIDIDKYGIWAPAPKLLPLLATAWSWARGPLYPARLAEPHWCCYRKGCEWFWQLPVEHVEPGLISIAASLSGTSRILTRRHSSAAAQPPLSQDSSSGAIANGSKGQAKSTEDTEVPDEFSKLCRSGVGSIRAECQCEDWRSMQELCWSRTRPRAQNGKSKRVAVSVGGFCLNLRREAWQIERLMITFTYLYPPVPGQSAMSPLPHSL